MLNRRALIELLRDAILIGGLQPIASSAMPAHTDIRRYGAKGDGRTDDTAAFAEAFNGNENVVILPKGLRFRIDGNVVLTNCRVRVFGEITGKGSFSFRKTVEISGPGVISLKHPQSGFRFESEGDFSVEGLRFEDCDGLAAILIAPKDGERIKRLSIRGCKFQRVNYGILRQAVDNLGGVDTLTIDGNEFEILQGDAIEINCAVQDNQIAIENNSISSIDNNGKKPFWGIGIGVAGRRYTENSDPEQTIRNFKISGNFLRNLRQGIHVEAARDFIISNNVIENVDPLFSKYSGLTIGAIVVYGSTDFQIVGNTVRKVTGGPAITIEYGVLDSRYVGAPKNYEIAENDLSDGGAINSNSDGIHSYVIIRQNVADSIRHRGQIGRFRIENNKLSGVASRPFELDFSSRKWLGGKVQIRSCGNQVKGISYEIDYRRGGRNVAMEKCIPAP